MNESKPNSGWNESKPSFPIAMNVNEAMAYASKDKCFWTGEMHIALETLGDEVERLRAELAAAKAASVVPVEVVDIATGDEVFNWPGDFSNHRCVELGSQDDAKIFEAWLRDRMNERGEG